MRSKFINFIILFFLLIFPVFGETAKANLTKDEAIKLLSATDIVKKKIGDLFSWTVGYDISKVNKVGLTPIVNYVKAVPFRIPPDGRTIIGIYASVNDPDGLANIAGVRADLGPIGRLPNTALVDNGMFGDTKAGDGVYTLQATVSPKTAMGEKDIPVSIANKKGWLALAKASLVVDIIPKITGIKSEPEILSADGTTPAKILIWIDNPGRESDVSEVSVDLSRFGLARAQALRNYDVVDPIWEVQFTILPSISSGNYSIPVTVANAAGGKASGKIDIKVGR
ncbi:MAG: hypothetical protein WCV91_01155 [Candidatus Margulisiibacteriota bacterium]